MSCKDAEFADGDRILDGISRVLIENFLLNSESRTITGPKTGDQLRSVSLGCSGRESDFRCSRDAPLVATFYGQEYQENSH